MKNLYKHLLTIIITLLLSQYTIAGTGAYVTLVNGTPYDWRATKHSSFQMDAWNYPKTLKAGESRRIYLEYIADENRSAMVKYEIAPKHFITIEFNGGYSDHRIFVSSNFSINGFDNSQVHSVYTIHNGMVSFILVGSIEDGFYTNFTTHSKDWMQNSLKLIGNKKLEKICIPGSHDAGMYMINYKTYHAAVCNTLTQDHGIFKQLEYGIRYFDIRPVIAGSNEFYTGHYGNTYIGYEGATGGKISDIIKDINNFTVHHKELIILELSHDFNTNDNYRGLDCKEWDNLYKQLSGINHLYIPSSSKRLKDLTLNDFIKDKAQVIILVDPSKLPKTSKYYRKGFFHTHEFSIYNSYADTNSLKVMSKNQFTKMYRYSSSRYFLLSWTLTQANHQAEGCNSHHANNTNWIKDLAKIANQSMPEEVFNKSTLLSYPNILYTDLIVDNNSAIMSMAINYRNLIDVNYTKAKKIATDHIFSSFKKDKLIFESSKANNNGRKELIFNYGIENLLLKVESSKSRIVIYHDFNYKNNSFKEFNAIPIGSKNDNINLLFTTKYDNHLVVGWIDTHLKESNFSFSLSTSFRISTLDLNVQKAKWVTKSYHFNKGEKIKGAVTLVENNTKKLCFFYNDQMIKYDFNPQTSEIKNPIAVHYEPDYLNKNVKLTQVLPYINNGKTEVLFVGVRIIDYFHLGLTAFQYFPSNNKFHKVYDFNNKENLVFVESKINKIYNMPENTKNKYITKRFQAFVLDEKKVPTTNYKISYIYTFGLAPNDSLITYLSTYSPTPPSFSYFLTDYNGEKALFASRNYTIKNNDTIVQTWFWYPRELPSIGGNPYNYINAMIFDSDNSKSPARLAARNTIGTINWKIYPNPIADYKSVTVEYEIKRNSNVEIKLYSIQGTLISSKIIKNNDIGKYIYQFDTENLSKGTYYITIRINNDFESKLLIVQ